jgi:hypothetical protein
LGDHPSSGVPISPAYPDWRNVNNSPPRPNPAPLHPGPTGNGNAPASPTPTIKQEFER